MIVLDTNVFSEPLRSHPDPNVIDWMRAVEHPVITAVSVGELFRGVRALPDGKRRDDLWAAVATTLDTFRDVVLPYDDAAARTYALLHDSRRRAGRPLSVEDGMIAAICISRDAALATRNVRDFGGLGLEVIDPWGG